MSGAWLEQRERGSLAAMRLITWITLRLGRRIGRTLLYPICLYFLVFSPRARRASRQYLARISGRRPGIADSFRHFHVFASTLHDRIAIRSGCTDEIEVTVHGYAALDAMLARGRGCLLLGSHLGSFEVLRVVGESRRRLAINLVMHEDNARKTSRWLRDMAPELAQRIIAPGTPATLLRVRECLTRDHLVPISRGGDNEWTNVVTACSSCNTRKGNRLPSECGMHPLHPPTEPHFVHLAWTVRRLTDTQAKYVRLFYGQATLRALKGR